MVYTHPNGLQLDWGVESHANYHLNLLNWGDSGRPHPIDCPNLDAVGLDRAHGQHKPSRDPIPMATLALTRFPGKFTTMRSDEGPSPSVL